MPRHETLARPRCRSDPRLRLPCVIGQALRAAASGYASSERHPRAARLVSLAVAIMTFHFGCKAVSDAIYAAGNRPKGEVSEGWR